METIYNDSEKINHKPKAWAISISIYIALLAALYFIKIVYEPIVELEALGVDLNYGVDLIGSGDIQTLNKANASKNNYDVKPAEKETEKKVSPVKPQAVEKIKTEATKVISKQPPVITSDEDTKVVVKKTTENAKPSVKPVESVPTKSKSSAPETPKAEPKRNVDEGSIFKKSSGNPSNSNGTVGTKNGVGGNNNGDGKAGEVGDKGDPKGTLDGKSIYGKPGTGGGKSGAMVSISGWKNKGPLNIPKDNSSETGKIKFKVIVDDFGDIVKIDVVETSVSPSVTNYYKNQITQKLKSNLVPEGTPPPRASGTITINITRGA